MSDSPEAVLLDEARRAIASQEAYLSTLHVKAVAVLSSAAVVAGLMGASIPAGHFGRFAITAIAAFVLTAMVAVLILRPVTLTFVGGVGPLLTHIDKELPAIDEDQRRIATRQFERQLAVDLEGYRECNEVKIKKKTTLFSCACALLGIQVVLWAAARLVA